MQNGHRAPAFLAYAGLNASHEIIRSNVIVGAQIH